MSIRPVFVSCLIAAVSGVGFLAFLGGCGGSSTEKTVSMDDITPVSTRDYSEDTSTAPVVVQKPGSDILIRLGDTLLKETSWKKWDTTLFADRFGPTVSEKWIALSGKDSLTIQHYKFKDSLRTKNAFFNLLDCFGKRCTSYVVGGNLRIPGRAAQFFIGEKDVYLIESSKSPDFEKIRHILSPDIKKQHWLYVVNIPVRGKTTWKAVSGDTETPITQSYENN